jgi:UDP-N-acetylmuramyl pentapeptide phosphotransferase/UDP-N-acetylglucosamine-1-phosphate transferase
LTSLLAAGVCAAIVTAAEPVLIPLLRRAAIDLPNLRSSHSVPTPRGGGAPIAAGLVAATLLLMHGAVAVTFAAAVAAFAAIGFADDLAGLTAARRLLLQGLASLAIAGVLVGRIGLPPTVLAAGVVAVAIWLIGFVNAFNFMDGVNGISAAHALIGGAAYACLGWLRSEEFLAVAGVAVAAGALAFLPWNAVRARVFLGDAGSYGLGVALAVLAVYSVIHGIPLEAALAPLALYLADTAWTLQRRIRAGERVFEAHRTHTYQQLCDVGWSHQRVTVTTAAVTVAVCVLGAASLTGHQALRAGADLVALGLLAAYLRAPALLGRSRELAGAAG